MTHIIRNLRLFFTAPKDFLYSYFTHHQEQVQIRPFSPQARTVSQHLLARLQKACPGVPFYLVGSTGLEICGRGDIDIYATAHPSKFAPLTQSINSILGAPQKNRPTFVEWHQTVSGFDVDLILIDPDTARFKGQMRLFNLFKNNPQYLKEYEQLKWSSNSLPQREYILKRMEFFNRLLSLN